MHRTELLCRLRTIAANSRELDSKLQDVSRSFGTCADTVSAMRDVSSKVRKVFVLHRELLGLLK